ncbi:ferric reductase [Jannaschia sp. EhC01]|nr:ferric reductase [Jannaschia sp. EhC01]
MRAALIWGALVTAIAVPLLAAGSSPLLQYRQPVYIIAGFAGILGLGMMLIQPLLVAGVLPGLARFRGRRVHRVIGFVLVASVAVHVAGLWIFSPPDVVDALLLRSPTPFSIWGVLAMWAIFAAAGLALIRRRLRLRVWRMGHSGLVSVAAAGTILHTVLIQGTMETTTKVALCMLVAGTLAAVLVRLRAWERGTR